MLIGRECWKEKRDFYQTIYSFNRDSFEITYGKKYPGVINFALYYYLTERILPLKSIIIYRTSSKNFTHNLFLLLIVSPLYKSEIIQSAMEIFGEVEDVSYKKIRIKIHPDNFKKKFKALVNTNKLMKEQTDAYIYKQIKRILSFIKKRKKPQIFFNQDEFNFKIDRSKTLIPLQENQTQSKLVTYYYNEMEDEKTRLLKTHQYLAAGENPNGWYGILGNTVLNVAIALAPNKVADGSNKEEMEYFYKQIKLIIAYGGKWNFIAPGKGLAPVEYAFKYNNWAVLEIFGNATHYPRRQILTCDRLITIDTVAAANQIITNFRFPKADIFSIFKNWNKVKDEEIHHIKKLYRQRFIGEEALASILEPEEGKYTELVYSTVGNFIGAIIFIVRFTHNTIYVYVDIAMKDIQYQDFGVIRALTYRFACGLQLLHPDKIIWLVFLSGHYIPFSGIEKLFAIPMYQTGQMVEEHFEQFKKLYGYKIVLHHSNVSECYVVEEPPVIVNGEHQSKIPSLLEELYQRYRGADDKIPINELKKRLVFVVVPIAMQIVKELQSRLYPTGINFLRCVVDMKNALLSNQLVEPSNIGQKGRFMDAAALLFHKIRIPAPIEEHAQLMYDPEHRHNLQSKY